MKKIEKKKMYMVFGNGVLTYSIGLINSDEATMSGVYINDYYFLHYIINEKNYLYSKGWSWTMTPCIYKGSSVSVALIKDAFDDVSKDDAKADSAIRPVISLKSDAITGGDGTVSNPFYVNEKPTI